MKPQPESPQSPRRSQIFALPLIGRLGHYLSIGFTAAFLVLAVIQVSGRLALGFAGNFAPDVNHLLEPYQFEAIGLSGGWQGFNPVLRAQRLEFPAGYLQNLYVEVDFFRTVAQRSLVFRRLHSEKGDVGLIYTDNGWRFKNSGGPLPDIDLQRLARGIAMLDVSIDLVVERLGAQFAYAISFQLNRSVHNLQGQFSLSGPAVGQMPTEFNLNFERHQDEDGQQLGGSTRHVVRVGGTGDFYLPSEILGGTGVLVKVSQGQWLDIGSSPNAQRALTPEGSIVADVRVLQGSNGAPSDLSPGLRTAVSLRKSQDTLLMQVNGMLESAETLPLKLPPVFAALDLRSVLNESSMDSLLRSDPPQFQARTTDLSLTRLTDFANAALVPNSAVAEWIRALDLRADLTQLLFTFDTDQGFEFWAQTNALAASAYRGSPSINNANAEIFGDLRNIGMRVWGDDVVMHFPELFTDSWPFAQVEGDLMLLFRAGYASVRGSGISARSGESLITGSFATSRPLQRYEQRLSLALQIDQIELPDTRQFIPYKLSDGLRQWLLAAPLSGDFDDVRLAHHGQIHVQSKDVTRRRFELMGDFSATQVRYEKPWPILTEGKGFLHVAGRHTYADLTEGVTGGFNLQDAKIHVDANRSMVFLSLQNTAPSESILSLIRSSPLQQSLNFITPEWRAEGEVNFAADIGIPLMGPEQNQPSLSVQIDADFESLDLDMPNYRLVWRDLAGQQKFSLPHNMRGRVTGLMYDQPTEINVSHDSDHILFRVSGEITADDLFRLADMPPSSIIQGEAAFVAKLRVSMEESASTVLQAETELIGLSVNLPAQFGKVQSDASLSRFDIAFNDDHQRIDWKYGGTAGWVITPDSQSQRVFQGAVGIDAQPLQIDPEHSGLVVNGQLPYVDLADWISEDGDAAVVVPFDWQLRDLQIDDFSVNDLHFKNLRLSGQGLTDSTVFQLQSEQLSGSVDLSAADVLGIDLLTLRLPEPFSYADNPQGNFDPIEVNVGRTLPHANVFVNQLFIGDEPFGRWAFEVTPKEGGVRFDIDEVLVNGVHIRDSAVFWDLERNRSAFSGAAQMKDLAEVLPLWGYAPMVTSETASVAGNLSWEGSPANLDILKSEGELSLAASTGRFLDIEAGSAGLRAVSLLNITALTKRISFDFSDVVGDGISFEEVYGDIQLEDEALNFTKNMIIKSTSSRYELGGEVDLRSNALNAEMIVTLPVSDSLPWYAAYLAFANPLAGLGVAVGERVFRKRIERMSSAKFALSGTLENPDVVFTELFNQDIEVTDSAGDRLSPDLLKNQPFREAEASQQ